MSNITIRDMQQQEAAEIAALHEQIQTIHANGRPDLFIADYEDAMGLMLWHAAQEDKRVLVAERDSQLLGYAVIQYVNREATPYSHARRSVHVEELCVDENHRRSGAGRALMSYITEDAKKRAYPRVELDVWDFNESARNFYHAIGMSEYRHFLEYSLSPYRFERISPDHTSEVLSLYDSLRNLPGCTWDDEYPDRQIIEEDIRCGYLFGMYDQDALIAVGAALPDDELTHLSQWQIPSEKPCVLSRIGVRTEMQGKGLAAQLVAFLADKMHASGYDTARMLVSPGNDRALRAYRNSGFTHCGSVVMYNEEWLCFEKKLN
ncbi:MAG: GNAT family N-acetyltransferase [Clostridia bacterium]|nr:GNAT family N-acetyltransferase [Clostridia bacterium]